MIKYTKNIPSNIPGLMERLENLQSELDKSIKENRILVKGIKSVINDDVVNRYTVVKLKKILNEVEEDA